MSRMLRATITSLNVAVLALMGTGCGQKAGDSGSSGGSDLPGTAIVAGKYIILDTRTDQGDPAQARRNAENTIKKYPDIDCMVGLWAYNPVQCLEALKLAGKEGEIAIVAFDEADLTMQGIIDGHVHGTVVQQPFEFGYQCVRFMKAIAEGDKSVIPESAIVPIPTRVIRKDNAQEYWDKLKELQRIGEEASSTPQPESEIRVAFVTNCADPFWNYARAGCAKAQADLGIAVDFKVPHDGSAAEQNKILQNYLSKGGIQGLAVSPLDPKNQHELMNQVAAKVPLLCHDSDAPDTERLMYVGTDNYAAGREAGKLVKEALPDGGKIMIYVGKLDVLNARQRRQGVIDELLGVESPDA